MSKSEKLTNLICKVRKFSQRRADKCWDGLAVIDAYADYCYAPDDPPPEMPECVRRLVESAESRLIIRYDEEKALAKAVRDYYAQPLKLEVGGVYQDAGGGQVKIVHRNPEADFVFCWLGYCGPLVGWYADDGKPAFLNRPPLIRRIS